MTRFLRLPMVLDITGLNRATLYEMMARGDFPQSVKIGTRAIAWPQSEVQEWAEARLAERGSA